MKFVFAVIVAILAVSAFAEEIWDVDWKTVVPRSEIPGFWDGRDVKPAFYPGYKTRTGRIIGGEIVTPNSHPYQAALLLRLIGIATGLCAGSLISPRAVLTVAHGPQGTFDTQVILGAHQINTVEPSQQRFMVRPVDYRIHPSYNRATFANDIAILILPSDAVITPEVVPSVLPALGDSRSFAGELATVAGWGRMSDTSGATSSVLRSTQNTIITNEACFAIFGNIVIDSTLCMSSVGGRGTCNSDAGGPLTVPDGGRPLQVGIVTFNAGAGCESGLPNGFTRVTSFRQWITDNQNP